MEPTRILRRASLVVVAALLACTTPSVSEAKDSKPIPTDWKKIPKPPLNPFTIPEPKRIELSNGMVLFLLEDHELPFVQMQALVKTGGRLAPAEKTGLAEIFGETWRTGGTKTSTGDQLDDKLEARAAKVESNMDIDSAGLSLDCLKQDFDDVFAVFVDVLRNPAFAEDKITIAKGQMRAAISRRNDEPMGIADREATKLGYGADSPYSRVPEYATVASVTREDLVAWHAKYVQPNRILLSAVGDFDSKALEAKIRAAFESWPKGPDAKDLPAAYDRVGKPGVYFVEKSDVNQSNIALLHLGITRDNPDYYAVEVMNEVLGGGFAARLFSNIRSKKGLAYSVRGGIGSAYDHPGLFKLSMSTKSQSTAAAIDALHEEIDGLLGPRPATADELKRAKEAILNSFIFKFDSKDKVLTQQVVYAYFGYPADFLSRYRAGIEKVTVEDVNRVAKTYIHKDKLALLVVGKAADFDRPLSSFGAVKTIDISIPEPPAKKAAATTESVAKAKTVWAKAVESLGGAAKIGALKELQSKGKLELKKPMAMSLDVVESVRFPDSVRQEMTTPMGVIAVVLSPKAAFQAMGERAMDLPGSAKEEAMKDLKRHPIAIAQALAAGKAKINHAGADKAGTTACDLLDVENDGAEVRLWIDSANGRILRSSYRTTGESGPVEAIADYSDWKAVDGVWFAMTERVSQGGEESQVLKRSEMKLNPGLDSKLFEKPAGK